MQQSLPSSSALDFSHAVEFMTSPFGQRARARMLKNFSPPVTTKFFYTKFYLTKYFQLEYFPIYGTLGLLFKVGTHSHA